MRVAEIGDAEHAFRLIHFRDRGLLHFDNDVVLLDPTAGRRAGWVDGCDGHDRFAVFIPPGTQSQPEVARFIVVERDSFSFGPCSDR